ncbi:MAG: T9SS type A sorting domain-containing protein [Saprospiraceae bacterium]|nr:T9SS type A sorting domain-containing protein [Saprospiraceae bacterium]
MKKILILSLLLLSLDCPAQIMFPGDANNDGLCNHVDILPIGILFGQEVIPRNAPSLNWVPQDFPLFPAQLPTSGVLFSFSDSDGNGFIDATDLDALALNYDQMQNQSQPFPQPYLLDDTLFTTNVPTLRLRFLQDTVFVSDTAVAILEFFSPLPLPANQAALGLAIELNYETDNVKDSLTSVYVDSMPGDLMFVASAFNYLRIWRTNSGTIEFGAAGKGQNTLNKTRELASFIIIIDDILRSGITKPFTMSFGNVLVVNNHEQVLKVKLETDTVILFQPTDGAFPPRTALLNISPNPAGEWLFIESPDSPVMKAIVSDAWGRQVESVNAGHQNQLSLKVGHLPQGLYILAVQTRKGVMLRKFLRLE